MRTLSHLSENNRKWAESLTNSDRDFFLRLSQQQAPHYLWIGCSDSRVPANDIVGLAPGELFVHRNVSNLVVANDLNCLAVIQFAVEVLKVEHIIVCGHYGCGGIQAALRNDQIGPIDHWLEHIRTLACKHRSIMDDIESESLRRDKLCELNIIEQVVNVCRTSFVENAWARNQTLAVHGWIYSLSDGLLRDMGVCITGPDEIVESYDMALQNALGLAWNET